MSSPKNNRYFLARQSLHNPYSSLGPQAINYNNIYVAIIGGLKVRNISSRTHKLALNIVICNRITKQTPYLSKNT